MLTKSKVETMSPFHVENVETEMNFVESLREFQNTCESRERAQTPLFVAMFTASYCGPCRLIKQKIEGSLCKLYANNVIFVYIDIEKNQQLAKEYNIQMLPTFYFMRLSGNSHSPTILDQVKGANVVLLVSKIDKHIIVSRDPPGKRIDSTLESETQDQLRSRLYRARIHRNA